MVIIKEPLKLAQKDFSLPPFDIPPPFFYISKVTDVCVCGGGGGYRVAG